MTRSKELFISDLNPNGTIPMVEIIRRVPTPRQYSKGYITPRLKDYIRTVPRTIVQISEELGISQPSVRRRMSEMYSDGLIEKHGTHKNKTYVMVRKHD